MWGLQVYKYSKYNISTRNAYLSLVTAPTWLLTEEGFIHQWWWHRASWLPPWPGNIILFPPILPLHPDGWPSSETLNNILMTLWYDDDDVTQYTGKGRNLTIEDIPALTDLLTDAFFNFGIDRSSKQTNIFAHNLLFQQPHWQVIDTIDQPQPQRMH